MAITPEQLVESYRKLDVQCLMPGIESIGLPIFSVAAQRVDVESYISGLNTYRQQMRSSIRAFLDKEAKRESSGIRLLSNKVWALEGITFLPIYRFDDDMLARVFSGRGSVMEITDTLRIVSLMMAMKDRTKEFLGAADLATYVQWFIGLDCNGFVGNYLRSYAGAEASFTGKSCAQLASGTARKHAKEVAERDFLLFYGSPNHIAIVGEVHKVDGDWVYCNVCDSRGAQFKGVQTKPWKIKYKNSSSWTMYRVNDDLSNANGAARTNHSIVRNPLCA